MNFIRVWCVLLLLTLFIVYSETFISIRIDPDDFESVNDFFQRNLIRSEYDPLMEMHQSKFKKNCLKIFKKTSIAIIQLCSLMIALVGSNLLTTRLDYVIMQPPTKILLPQPQSSITKLTKAEQQHQQQQSELEIMFKNFLFNTTNGGGGVCSNDFGCNKNVCWRSCYSDESSAIPKWCFSAPNPQKRRYHACTTANDCSPCWECLDVCHD